MAHSGAFGDNRCYTSVNNQRTRTLPISGMPCQPGLGEGQATTELASRRADGSTYLCEVTLSPISDERGVLTHWLHVRRDLTQRRLELI